MAHSSYLSTYRLDNYAPRLHMSVYQPEVLWSGTITATPTFPTWSLAVSYTSSAPDFGTYGTSGPPGFRCAEVVFRDPVTGKRKGTTRVRANATTNSPWSSSTVLAVREISEATCPVVEDDVFQIRAFYPLETKLINDLNLFGASYGFSPDGRYYIAEGENPGGISNCGGHYAGWASKTTGLATYNPSGSASIVTDPDGGGQGHEWAIVAGGGAVIAGGTSATPTLSLPVGDNCVSHYVYTSGGSGLESRANVSLIIHDDDNLPHEVILKDYSGDVDRGVSWTVEVTNGAIDDETIPDGMLCILWVDDSFGSTTNTTSSPYGTTSLSRSSTSGRSHIIGVGYISRTTSDFSGDDGAEHIIFEIQSPMMRLSNIASYSQVFQENSSPTWWEGVKTLGFKRAILNWWEYYTTGMEAGIDFTVDNSFDDARYPQIYIQRSDIISQMRQIADARNGRIVSVERGAGLQLQAHPALLELANRP